MPITFVNKLQNKLSEYQDKVSKDSVYAYLLSTKIEDLLEEAKRLKVYFISLNVEIEVIEELEVIIKQTAQFLEDVKDIIELNRKRTAIKVTPSTDDEETYAVESFEGMDEFAIKQFCVTDDEKNVNI